jgi:hypothetical protein
METAMINSHRHSITELALSVGIDFDKVAQRLHYETHGQPISGNIAIDKKANEGNPYIHVNTPFIDSKGNKYPNITFGTHAHGGYAVNFNGYREAQTDKLAWINYPKPQPEKPLKTDKTWRIKALESATISFNSATNTNVSTHPYIIKKGVNVADCDIRLCGGLLQYAIQDIEGKIIAYQTIDADGNKRFIGKTSGGFVVIGDANLIQFGAIFVEGLATALSTFHCDILNPKKSPVVVCLDAGNIRKVVAAFVEKYGAGCVNLYADNDCGLNEKGEFTGNTGVFVALEICHEHSIESFKMPISVDGLKCDFNDTQEHTVVEVPEGIDYQIELLKVAPKQSLKKLFSRFTNDVLRETRVDAKTADNNAEAYFTISECVEIITRAAALRDISCNVNYLVSMAIARQIAYKATYLVNEIDIENITDQTLEILAKHEIEGNGAAIRKMLSHDVTKRREIQRKLKIVTDLSAFNEVINVDGLTPNAVSEEIERESELNKIMVFDNAGMGGQKTNRMVAYSKGLKGGIAYISPLVSVCKNAGDRLDFVDYQGKSEGFFNTYRHTINAVFCINSIPKGNIAANFSHLLMDEAVAVYDSIFDDNGTNKHQQKLLIDNLRMAFQAVDSIVIADAALADKHVAFYKSLCNDKKTILLEITPLPNNVNHYLLQNHSHSHEFILRDVLAGKSGVVACDTVANATAVKKYLRDNGVGTRIDINRVLLATGENNGETDVMDFIEKPNDNAYRWDVVIHSPIIRSGTSIEYADYEFSYLLYDGVISTSDAMQMWGRCRAAKDRYVSFGTRIDRTRVTDFELLFEIERNELEQKGITVAGYDELARLRHDFTATVNADKNDFKNNFLFHCEISGREIIRLESDTKIDRNLTAEVKAQRCEDRLNAEVLTPTKYHYIKQANRRTQAETDAMKRFEVAEMVHGDNASIDSVITVDDCMNEMDGMIKPLLAYESLTADTKTLKALDKADKENDCLKFSRVDLQKALNEVLKPLQVATEKDGIEKKDFNKACDKLEKHAAILAAAGLGNFKKISRVRAGRTIQNFAAKIGYDINDISVTHKRRIYELKTNEDISRYTTNRKGLATMEKGL